MARDARRRPATLGEHPRRPAVLRAPLGPPRQRRPRLTAGGAGIVELPMAVTPVAAAAGHRHQPGAAPEWLRRRLVAAALRAPLLQPRAARHRSVRRRRPTRSRRRWSRANPTCAGRWPHKLAALDGDAGRGARGRGQVRDAGRSGRGVADGQPTALRRVIARGRARRSARSRGRRRVRPPSRTRRRQRREPAAHPRDQLLVRLRLPALRQHADRVARNRCRCAGGASPRRAREVRARSIAVSSAMLLVPTPRYSPSSRRLPPSIGDDADAHRARDSRSRRRRSTAPAPAPAAPLDLRRRAGASALRARPRAATGARRGRGVAVAGRLPSSGNKIARRRTVALVVGFAILHLGAAAAVQGRLPRLVGAHPDPLSFEPHANPGHRPHYYARVAGAPAVASSSSSRRLRAARRRRRSRADRRRAAWRCSRRPRAWSPASTSPSCAPARPPPRSRRWRCESQADQKTLAEFARRTGFDPVKQIEQHHRRLPRGRARAAATSACCCAPITSTRRAWSPTCATSCRRTATIWCDASTAASRSGRRSAIPSVVGFFVDERTFVLGAGGVGRAHGRPRRQRQPRRQRRDQPRAGPPRRARGRHARHLGGGDRARRDAARRSPARPDARRGRHDQHAVAPRSISARAWKRC